MKKPRIAIIHDWLTGMRGGEKCLEVFCELFPEATLFTLLHVKGSVSPVIERMDIRTSFLQGLPGVQDHYRHFLPLFPKAVESFDLSGYDIVLSSSHCVAKGARKADKALHISYCYTPMRYAWKFYEEYFGKENILKRKVIRYFLGRLKRWDVETNKKVDYFIAISHNVKQRIREFYGRDADVIYPPAGRPCGQRASARGERYYLLVSALVPYKRVDLAVRAFNQSGRKLVVIGSGSDDAELKKETAGNITFRGWVSEGELSEYYSGCEALIFPGEEDFGIVTVEAQSFGKPVIAYARGGALETVIPLGDRGPAGGLARSADPTGVFFDRQEPEALNGAIDTFETNRHLFTPESIVENSRRFSRERFKNEIRDYINEKTRP